MARKLAVQMDDIASINPKSDSSLALMHEAQIRGAEVWYYTPRDLSLKGAALVALARKVSVELTPTDWYKAEAPQTLALSEMDVVLMRQDPPFDMSYITATYLLEQLPAKTRVLNNPASVRNFPEKLLPLHFPSFTPETLISAHVDDIRAFHREHGEIVIKPLYGFGGHGVFHIDAKGRNLEALLELYLSQSREPVMAQRFLKEVATGERRAIMIDGKCEAIFGRLPPEGEIRANMRVGGTAQKAELTPRQREATEAMGPFLREKGMVLAGVDFIGDYLTEINITSPTGLRAANALYGVNLAETFWNAVEKR